MSLFGNLTNEGLEQSEDRIGGFSLFDTDAYLCTIKAAYAGQSTGGAQSLTLVVDADGKEYSETLYVTNRKGENFFLNKDDKTKKIGLPGFTIADHICLVTCEKHLNEMTGEEKVMNVYDPAAGRQMPKNVPMVVELIGKQLYLGIVKNLENKNEKQGDEYVPTAETRETNNIEKVFHFPTKLTVPEVENEKTEAEFFDAWVNKNKGQVRDKRKIKDGDNSAGQSGRPGGRPSSAAPTAGAAAAGPKKSLFGKN
jgi:hypothetical protein